MTLQDYMSILRRSWPLIAIATVVGALIALGLSLAMTPVYQAQSQLFVSVKSAGAAGDAYTGGLFVQQRVKSYVDVVDSPAVLDPVIKELELDKNYVSLAGQVSAQTPPNTVLLNVTATDTSPIQAARIANATATSYAQEIARLEGAATTKDGLPRLGSNQNQIPVQATVIKPAEVPGAPISPRTQLNLLLGALLGLLLGVGIAVLRHTLDTSVKTVEDLEEAADSTPWVWSPSTRRPRRIRWSPCAVPRAPKRSAASARTCSTSTSTTRPRAWSSHRPCLVRASPRPPATWRSPWPRRAPRCCCWRRTCAARRWLSTSAWTAPAD